MRVSWYFNAFTTWGYTKMCICHDWCTILTFPTIGRAARLARLTSTDPGVREQVFYLLANFRFWGLIWLPYHNVFYCRGRLCRKTVEIAGIIDHEYGHGMDLNCVSEQISYPSHKGIIGMILCVLLSLVFMNDCSWYFKSMVHYHRRLRITLVRSLMCS